MTLFGRRTVESRGRSFHVPRGVFDPERHLSGVAFAGVLPELVAERTEKDGRALEIGTGCGILAAAIREVVDDVTATDIDPTATDAARGNLVGLDIDLRTGDLFEPVIGERYDLVVMNPPYEIGRSRRPTLRSPDVLRRLGRGFGDHGPLLLIGFPAGDVDLLESELDRPARRIRTVETAGDALGVFEVSAD